MFQLPTAPDALPMTVANAQPRMASNAVGCRAVEAA